GDFARDLTVRTDSGDVRLAELLRSGHGVLLDLADNPGVSDALRTWAGPDRRVRYVLGTSEDARDLAGLLVRPDGYTAWAADAAADPAQVRADVGTALRTWFGAA